MLNVLKDNAFAKMDLSLKVRYALTLMSVGQMPTFAANDRFVSIHLAVFGKILITHSFSIQRFFFILNSTIFQIYMFFPFFIFIVSLQTNTNCH